MQGQLSFVDTMLPEGSAPVWAVLEDGQRAEVVAILARLIARATLASHEESVSAETEEKDDE